MKGTPILKLAEENITSLFYDSDRDVALVGLSTGRILMISALASTAYSAGSRRMYAQAEDSFGNLSSTSSTPITYALWKQILHVAEGKGRQASKSVKAYGASLRETVSAVFITPVLFAGDDFERWHTILWDQVPGQGEVTVFIRAAVSETALVETGWKVFREEGSGSFSKSLDDICQNGPWAQAKVEMRSSSGSPSIGSLGIFYGTKHASYFFTTKLVLEKGSNATSGLVTASATKPANTEVVFGIAPSNTADWKEYQVVELDKVFQMPDGAGDRFKVGIKLVSYDTSSVPEVDEFAISIGAEKDNLLNQ